MSTTEWVKNETDGSESLVLSVGPIPVAYLTIHFKEWPPGSECLACELNVVFPWTMNHKTGEPLEYTYMSKNAQNDQSRAVEQVKQHAETVFVFPFNHWVGAGNGRPKAS